MSAQKQVEASGRLTRWYLEAWPICQSPEAHVGPWSDSRYTQIRVLSLTQSKGNLGTEGLECLLFFFSYTQRLPCLSVRLTGILRGSRGLREAGRLGCEC